MDKIHITITCAGAWITLPVNPESVSLSAPGRVRRANVIGLGEVASPEKPGLRTLMVSSFLPGGFYAYDPGAGGDMVSPSVYVDFIEGWIASGKPARLTAAGLGLDMPVLAEEFDWERRAAEEEDVYYSIKFTEYRPYGVTVIQAAPLAEGSSDTASPPQPPSPARADNRPPTGRTYTVAAGDSLWSIAKRLSDKEGADWRDLYELNKELLGPIVGDRPERLMPGDVLILPESWAV